MTEPYDTRVYYQRTPKKVSEWKPVDMRITQRQRKIWSDDVQEDL